MEKFPESGFTAKNNDLFSLKFALIIKKAILHLS